MHEILKEYFEKQKEIREKEEKELRETILIEEGLYEKIYSENNKPTKEYNHGEYVSSGTYKYFKYQPIDITDEEYMQIKEIHDSRNKQKSTSTNAIATALTVMALIIFFGGFIMGIVFGNDAAGLYENFAFGVAFVYWSIALISGILFLGFAEVIKLLDDIKNK